MLTILIHTSKTTRHPTEPSVQALNPPAFLQQANLLAGELKQLTIAEIQKAMNISPSMADKTYDLIQSWQDDALLTLPAIDLFLGDIYSGLQVQSLTESDRQYAHEHLCILSGMYGVLRALDEIQPYRLEMGYKLPAKLHGITSLYSFWGDQIAGQLPKNQAIVNLSAVEYTKAVFPHLKNIEGLANISIVSPKFLTINPKSGEAVFVTVHTKIARGAFARWMITERIDSIEQLKDFNELGYTYSQELSMLDEPVFVAKEFKGIGLSVRLT